MTRVFWMGQVAKPPRAPDGFRFYLRIPGGPRPGEEGGSVLGEVHLSGSDEPARPYLGKDAWIALKGTVGLRRWQSEGDPVPLQNWFVQSGGIIPIGPPLAPGCQGRNWASLAGRLVDEVRPCPGGCEFNLKVLWTSQSRTHPMWIPTTIYGEIGEKAKRQLVKGRAVTVEGALHFGHGPISRQPRLSLRGTDFWRGSACYDNPDEVAEPERDDGDEGSGGLAPY